MLDEHKLSQTEEEYRRKYKLADLTSYGYYINEILKGNIKYFSGEALSDQDTAIMINSAESMMEELSNTESGSLDSLILLNVIPKAEIYTPNSHILEKIWREVERVLKTGGMAYILPLDLDENWDIRHVTESLSLIERHSGGECSLDFPKGSHSIGELLTITKKGRLYTEKDTKEIQRISHNAIGDAMVYAYGYDSVGYDVSDGVIKGNLRGETKDDCDENSRKVIRFMLQKYPDHFDRMFILDSRVDDAHPFKQGFSNHSLFVLRDLSGRWYVGSPSNYEDTMEDPENKNRLPNTLTDYYEGESLAEVIKKYQGVYGGDWGDIPELNSFKYVHPVKDPWLHHADELQLSVVTRYIYDGHGGNYKYYFSTAVSQGR